MGETDVHCRTRIIEEEMWRRGKDARACIAMMSKSLFSALLNFHAIFTRN